LVDELVLETSFKLGRLLFRRAGREPSENTIAPLLELDRVPFPTSFVRKRADWHPNPFRYASTALSGNRMHFLATTT
jgi:hypothetical protein